MACRDAYKMMKATEVVQVAEIVQPEEQEVTTPVIIDKLFFGVDSTIRSDDVLQNNLTEFEWASRNKLYPNFWGRNITGENRLTKDEIDFLHGQGCKIAVIGSSAETKETEDQGKTAAGKLTSSARDLEIPSGTAIFLELPESENTTTDYMKGFAGKLMQEGYIPGFKANTDAAFSFDREFSRGLQTDKDVFGNCLVWAITPSLKEYERVTTTHLIHPDNWVPFAPSGITRKDIAVWQYGKECHPIYDDKDHEVTFNVNLVRNDSVIMERMF